MQFHNQGGDAKAYQHMDRPPEARLTSLYMINPRPSVTQYDTAPGFASTPDLAIVTVAALAPSHWTVSVCEECCGEIDFDTPAVFVGLTGKNAHLARMIELATAFRSRGKVVLIGGPLASLDPESLRMHADILVTGEIEEIAPKLFADLEAGTWANSYDGGRADIRKSPVPRWDLYPVDRALMGAVQTTRGCPFDCEFCDVIMYQGRKQRHKDVEQVLCELDVLHAAGFRQVFLTDDNFTVHRAFARTMLDAIAEWNSKHADDPMRFVTQASMDIARDDDLLLRCQAAGLTHLFVGIETINAESLRETRKRQNLLLPPLEAVERIVSHGILVRNGIMVGFDNDGPDIFETLYEFLQASPLPASLTNVLMAAKGTPLYVRLKREGRLLVTDQRWDEGIVCNFMPKQMSRETLMSGAWAFTRRLYAPAAFEQRIMKFIALFGAVVEPKPSKSSSAGMRGSYAMACIRKAAARGADEADMVSRVLAAGAAKPQSLRSVITCLVFYEQYRAYLDTVSNRLALAA